MNVLSLSGGISPACRPVSTIVLPAASNAASEHPQLAASLINRSSAGEMPPLSRSGSISLSHSLLSLG